MISGDRPMSILQVITQRRFSGAERIALSLSADLQKRGHRVLLLCKPDGEMPAYAAAMGIDALTPAISGKLNLAAPFIIADMARKFGADLIHTHLSTASLWGGIAGRMAKIPVLSHVHALNTWFYYRFSTMAATCSGGVRTHMINQGADPDKVRVIYNGIPAERLEGVVSKEDARSMLGIGSEQPVVACVAHLSPKKGQKYLLEALALLKHSHPDLVCIIAGEGEQRELLQQMSVELGICDRVHLLGFRDDVMSVMNAADLVILPSVAKEGLGLALVEAALLEKPTIGSNAPGIDEALLDGLTGILVPPADSAALSVGMASLLDDPELRKRLGRAGRERALKIFSQQAMVDGFDSLYREIISGGFRR